MAQNPLNKMRSGYNLAMPSANSDNSCGGNRDVFNAGVTTDAPKQNQKAESPKPVKIEFPNHLYIPEGAQSLDFRKVVNLPAGSVDFELFSFTAPPGAVTRFLSYGVFNDGNDGADYEFKPLLDGRRIFGFHGDPALNFKIYLGLAPDLSEIAMIPCQLYIQPGQTVKWLLTNTSAVDTSMGVRMTGYFDSSQQRVTGRFGG